MTSRATAPSPSPQPERRGPPVLSRLRLAVIAVGLGAYLVALLVAIRGWDLPPPRPELALVLVGALLCELLSKYLLGVLFRGALARQGRHIALRSAFAAALVGTATARLLPAGGAVAPSAMAWAVREQDGGAAGAALRITLLGYGGLLVVTGLSIGWGAAAIDDSTVLAGTALPGAALAGVGVLVLIGSRWLRRVVAYLPTRLRRHFEATAAAERITGPEALLAVTRIGIEAGVLWLVLVGSGVDIDPPRALLVFGTATVIGGLPISPGGLGTVEGGMLGLLVAMGFAADEVAAPVLIYRLINYWAAAGLGIAVASRLATAEPGSPNAGARR